MPSLRKLVADTRPLKVPAFRRVFFADIITEVGSQFTVFAVPAQIYADTGSSAYVGLAGLFGLVPLLVFGLYGGAMADHFNRRSLVLITSAGGILSSGLFWLQAALGNTNVWILLVMFSVQQVFFAINSPTRSAILPRIIKDHSLLPAANSLHMTVVQAGAIGGPLLAGVLLPFTGYTWLYAVDTVFLFTTLYAMWRLPSLPVERAPGETRRAPGIRSIFDGFAYLKGNTVLLMSFVVDLIAMIFGMTRALYPELAHLDFHGPSKGGLELALLAAAIPAGALLGGVFSGWISHMSRHGLVVIWAIVVWGLGVTGFGVAAGFGDRNPTLFLWVAFACMAVAGGADMISAVIRSSMLQAAADDNVRGRLQGVFTVVVAGGPRIADVVHGASAAAVGAATAAAGGGVLVVIGVVICAVAAPAFVRYRLTTPRQAG